MNTIFKDVSIVIVTIALTYYITIKVKFAKDEKQAIVHAKNFFLKVSMILMNIYIAYLLANELFSSAPLDRKSLFLILIYSFGLFHYLVSWYVSKLMSAIEGLSKIIGLQLKLLEKQPCYSKNNEKT
jgi:hypothetical protein